MTLSQFNCPHCSGPFQVDTPLHSLQLACPHCRQPVAFANEPPVSEPPISEQANSEPPVAESRLLEPPPTEPKIAEVPISPATSPTRKRVNTQPRSHSPADLLPPGAVISPQKAVSQPAEEHEAITDVFRSRQVMADDRATRKFVKNMIVWVCCAIVLVSILAFFLRQGGS